MSLPRQQPSSGVVRGLVVTLFAVGAVACSGKHTTPPQPQPPVEQCSFAPAHATSGADTHGLRINEVMTSNDGAWVDEAGQTDDFIELVNTSDSAISLSDYLVGDKPGKAHPLPDLQLDAGATVLLWADSDPEQGPLHLSFKLSQSGTPVLLWASSCELVDGVDVPELPTSESYARLPDGSGDFSICRYATPERENGDSCDPPSPPNLRDDITFAPYTWETPYPKLQGPLVLSELALRPAGFVEVLNAGDAAVDLSDYTLELASMSPGDAWPVAGGGAALAWPADVTSLAPGERVVVPVAATDTTELEA